jgi:hypothetical protein
MNPSFQRRAEISPRYDRLGTGMNPTLFRHDPAGSLQTSGLSHTARLFCGKMFGGFVEKSWQLSA